MLGRYLWRSPLSKVLVVLLALLGVLELSARAFQFSRGRTFDDALYGTHFRDFFFLGPSFNPSANNGAWQGITDLQINSLGFRGAEFPIAKPAGEYRIITFGGSTSHSGNYPEKLQRIIDNNPAKFGKNIKVINAAVPAWNTTQSLIQLLTRAIYLSPDVIVVYHAINDAFQRDDKWLKNLPAVDYRRGKQGKCHADRCGGDGFLEGGGQLRRPVPLQRWRRASLCGSRCGRAGKSAAAQLSHAMRVP